MSHCKIYHPVLSGELRSHFRRNFRREGRKISKKGKAVKFQIWDTAGQEKYRSVNKLFYSDAQVALLVYDITRMVTFNEIKDYWYQQVIENAPPGIQMVLVGNKSDLYEFQEVPTEDSQKKAEFFECSAKTASGVAVR